MCCRFEVEDAVPVLYVYEVQIVPGMQRRGLGAFLMTLLKLVAKKNQLEAIMLTIMNVGLLPLACVCAFATGHIKKLACAVGQHSCNENVHKAGVQAGSHISLPSRPSQPHGRPYRL